MEDEKPTFVMPAWIAGIQVRKDASGHIRVDPHPSASARGRISLGLKRARVKREMVRKIPSPIPMGEGEGEGEGNFIVCRRNVSS